ncbi:MAG: hypothetical protein JXA54_03415 [Candidatus Heimdallarchaeota archaeon]|nr:hypothetical protein [Candidatus Heimdallarchaeota archaeon]
MYTTEEIIDIFQKKKIDDSWSFEESKPSERGKWTHSYHRYPAKFIPQIVEKLLDEYIGSKTTEVSVNDPFFGCGTTIVSAISQGYEANGTDINKIAYLIAKVKATPIEPNYLKKKVMDFLAKINASINPQDTLLIQTNNSKPFIPEKHLERIDYWFDERTKIQLGKILRIIIDEKDKKISDFLKVAFSNCLKNCSIWLMDSTKPTRDMKKIIPNPYDVLKRHLNKMVRGNSAYYKILPSEVKTNFSKFLNIRLGDAREQPASDNSVDITITSSPYVTSYEYADLHQLSTIWLDLTDDLSEYRKEFIGTAAKQYNAVILDSEIANDIVSKLAQKDKRLSQNVAAFYKDMQEVFKENYRILKPGGRCCYVIGNTRLRKIDILNAEIFAESLQKAGFEFDRLIKRQIHSKLLPQLRDEKTGQFASNHNADTIAYPVEFIVIGLKR